MSEEVQFIENYTNLPTILFTGNVINIAISSIYTPVNVLRNNQFNIVQTYIPFYNSKNGYIYIMPQGDYAKISDIYDCISRINTSNQQEIIDQEVNCTWRIASLVSYEYQTDIWGIYLPDIEPFINAPIPIPLVTPEYAHALLIYDIINKRDLNHRFVVPTIENYDDIPSLDLTSYVTSSAYFNANNSNMITLTPAEIEKYSTTGILATALYTFHGVLINPTLSITVEELSGADSVSVCLFFLFVYGRKDQNVVYNVCKLLGEGDTVTLFTFNDVFLQAFAGKNVEPPVTNYILYRDPNDSFLALSFLLSIYPHPTYRNGKIVLRLDFTYEDNKFKYRTLSNRLIINMEGFHKVTTSPTVAKPVMTIDLDTIHISQIAYNGYSIRFCARAKTQVPNPFIGVKYVDGVSNTIVINGRAVKRGDMIAIPFWKTLPQGQDICATFTVTLDGYGKYYISLVTGYISNGKPIITDWVDETLKVEPYIKPTRHGISHKVSNALPYLAIGLGGLVFTAGLYRYVKSRK